MSNSKARSKRKSRVKARPIYLGLPDEAGDPQACNDVFSTALGGLPGWLDETACPPPSASICDSCGQPMPLVLQAYAPMDTSTYDRVLYVWGCNTFDCVGKPGSFKVVRGHRYNQEYAAKLKRTSSAKAVAPPVPAPPKATTPSPAFNLGDLWGSGFKKPDQVVVTATPVTNRATPSLLSSESDTKNQSDVNQLSERVAGLNVDSDFDSSSDDSDLDIDPGLAVTAAEPPKNGRRAHVGSNFAQGSNLRSGDTALQGLSNPLEADIRAQHQSTAQIQTSPENNPSSRSEGGGSTKPRCLPGCYLYTEEEDWEGNLRRSMAKYADIMETDFDLPPSPSTPTATATVAVTTPVTTTAAPTPARPSTSGGSKKKVQNPPRATNPSQGSGEDSATWAGEQYERDTLPEGMDKGLSVFLDRVSLWPDQCVRYDLGGTPLLYTHRDPITRTLYPPVTPPSGSMLKQQPTPPHPSATTRKYSTQNLPACQYCGTARVFECQIMPNTLLVLETERRARQRTASATSSANNSQKLKKSNGMTAAQELPPDLASQGMEWGTVLIFSCPNDCHLGVDSTHSAFFQEYVVVQLEAF